VRSWGTRAVLSSSWAMVGVTAPFLFPVAAVAAVRPLMSADYARSESSPPEPRRHGLNEECRGRLGDALGNTHSFSMKAANHP